MKISNPHGIILIIIILLLSYISIISINENVRSDSKTIYVGKYGPVDFYTIQSAVTNASDGDTIFVYNGTYQEEVRINKRIRLIGEDNQSTVIENYRGIPVKITADEVEVSGFTINGSGSALNEAGIFIQKADNVSIYDNILKNQYLHGIYISSSGYSYLDNNRMYGPGIVINCALFPESMDVSFYEYREIIKKGYFGEINTDYTSHTITTSNKVNSKSVYYYKFKNGGKVPADAGQVILTKCENMQISDQSMEGGNIGISLIGSSGIQVHNNTIKNCTRFGISIDYAGKNVVKDNKFLNDGFSNIYVIESFDNIVSRNYLTNSGEGIFIAGPNNLIENNTSIGNKVGIYSCTGLNCIIRNNTVINNHYGIRILGGSDNTIIENNIIKQADYFYSLTDETGIYLWSSGNLLIKNNTIKDYEPLGIMIRETSNNTIYNNRFINSSIAYSNISDNIWYYEYPVGGNYYSSFDGPDEYSGLNQSEPGSDGIIDRPFQSGAIYDKYPLKIEMNKSVDVYFLTAIYLPDNIVLINWTTAEPCRCSFVYYKESEPSSKITIHEKEEKVNHSIALTNLSKDVTYKYEILIEGQEEKIEYNGLDSFTIELDPEENKKSSSNYFFEGILIISIISIGIIFLIYHKIKPGKKTIYYDMGEHQNE